MSGLCVSTHNDNSPGLGQPTSKRVGELAQRPSSCEGSRRPSGGEPWSVERRSYRDGPPRQARSLCSSAYLTQLLSGGGSRCTLLSSWRPLDLPCKELPGNAYVSFTVSRSFFWSLSTLSTLLLQWDVWWDNSSVAFSAFTALYNYHLHPVLERSHGPRESPSPCSHHSVPPPPSPCSPSVGGTSGFTRQQALPASSGTSARADPQAVDYPMPQEE